MGFKGDKQSNESDTSANFLMDRLKDIDGISSKKMFGGHGIFFQGKMFGIVDSQGSCYFKVNDFNSAVFEEYKSRQHGKMPYFLVPQEILDHTEKLIELAQKSFKIFSYPDKNGEV